MTDTQQEKIRVHIIGTSHISADSVETIKTICQKEQPDVICVELDKQRLEGLLNPSKKKPSFFQLLRQVGFFGTFFVLLGGKLQNYLGKKYGLKPGSDMLQAVHIGKEHKIKIALIDQPIHITLRRLSKSIGFKEYCKMFFEFIVSLLRPKKTLEKYQISDISLSKVPSNKVILQLLQTIRKSYPSIYQSLIEERNIYMSKRIIKLIQSKLFSKIVVVVGAGHVPGMKEILQKTELIGQEYEINYHID